MKACIATVDLVIRAGSWAEACDRLNCLLTATGIHYETDPFLFDWAYVPDQKFPEDAWPKEIELPEDWIDLPDEPDSVARLFPDREHIEPMLVMSTAHLDPQARRFLDSGASIVIPFEHGWIVYAKIEHNGPLATLLDYALRRACLWIKFDGAGPLIDDLPVYDL
ncbi:hypothetical protein ATER59S_00535 [Aquamicrobium terrae]